jgi:cytochrome c-type biogenesis protein CcmH/NrfF
MRRVRGATTRRTGGVAVLALLASLVVPVVGRAATQQEVEESLTCQCGCGLTVHACNHLQCPSGEPIKKDIAERLARGESKDTILAAYRQRYGEKVLSSPTFAGFNWLAWIMPFAAVLVGGLAMAVVIRRWTRAAPAAPPPPAAAADEGLRRRLAEELDRLDREDAT